MSFPTTRFAPKVIRTRLSLPGNVAIPVSVATLAVTTRPFDEAGELYYLQVIRQLPSLLEGDLMKARGQAYLRNVASIAKLLMASAGAELCDSMVGVPTSRAELLAPYLLAAQGANQAIRDLTTLVHRDQSAGTQSGLSFEDRQARHALVGTLPQMQRLLVIDDVLGTGQSIAHVIELLRQHTTALPEILIAAPLWVPVKDLGNHAFIQTE